VVYANYVLGARTSKYPDFLDIAIALTSRAPYGGMRLPENKVATVVVDASLLSTLAIPDDLLYAAMGYCIGHVSGSRRPTVIGADRETGVKHQDSLGFFFSRKRKRSDTALAKSK